jgi:hypothetical protein
MTFLSSSLKSISVRQTITKKRYSSAKSKKDCEPPQRNAVEEWPTHDCFEVFVARSGEGVKQKIWPGKTYRDPLRVITERS